MTELPRYLFPPIEPNVTGMLALDGLHGMYWEECGNPQGAPVVFLHGGPGAGASPVHRQFFDPAHYRILVYDQRGAGRSLPLGALARNTTADLVGDLERLRVHRGIDRWLVFGGSWGSTLALSYAQAHPERCSGLILRGIFLSRRSEIDWFLHGMGRFFPEAHAAFAGFVPPHERGDLLTAYYARLTDPDPAVHRPAALAWSRYEGSCSALLPSPASVAMFDDERTALGLARIEAHYFIHGSFMADGALLEGIDAIRHLPATIVQGRYDMVCPICTADALHRAWPEADYVVVPDSGHSALEPGTCAALIAATEAFRARTPDAAA